MGAPGPKWNNGIIENALLSAAKMSCALGPPYLIEPKRYFVETIEQSNPQYNEEWLPQIECIGVFSSLGPVRDMTKDASSLIVVWYQPEFGLDKNAIEEIRNIDWDKYAIDWEY